LNVNQIDNTEEFLFYLIYLWDELYLIC
jgi:hypothetical protein